MTTRSEVSAHIGLGANLGDPGQALHRAIEQLSAVPGVRLLQASSFYRSAPIDSSGPDYINAVVEIATTLTAPGLLTALQVIERSAGRERPYVNAPRTLDLDLLLYGQARVASRQLTLPHPRMWGRAFVLLPLHEISPGLVPRAVLQAVTMQDCVRCAASGPVQFSAAARQTPA